MGTRAFGIMDSLRLFHFTLPSLCALQSWSLSSNIANTLLYLFMYSLCHIVTFSFKRQKRSYVAEKWLVTDSRTDRQTDSPTDGRARTLMESLHRSRRDGDFIFSCVAGPNVSFWKGEKDVNCKMQTVHGWSWLNVQKHFTPLLSISVIFTITKLSTIRLSKIPPNCFVCPLFEHVKLSFLNSCFDF